MQNLTIFLRKQNSEPYGFVYFLFYTNRQKVLFSSKIKCLDKYWDQDKCIIKQKDPNAKEKNIVIENQRATIVKIIVDYRLRSKTLTREQFFKHFNQQNTADPLFHPYWYKQLMGNKRHLALSTVMSQRSVMNKLKEFSPQLEFEQITPDFLTDYYYFLRKKLRNTVNTAHRNMKIVMKFVNMAIKDGYIDQNPFEGMHIPTSKSKFVYLTEEELQKMTQHYHREHLSDMHRTTLGIFLFLSFAGIHIGDARTVKIEHITQTHLIYQRKKTQHHKQDPINVPISKSLQWIIDILKNGRKHGYLLPNRPADQTINSNLKEIARELKIKKNITTKVGRHTFATIYLNNTKDLNALREILGHSNIRETLIYAHVLEQTQLRNIEYFDKFIE